MVRHAEFGANTFMGTPAEAEAHVSSPTAQGYFAIFAWFDYEEGGGAVFELRLHMQAGIQDVLRRGPSLTALAHEGPGLLQERLRHAEREGVRFCPCSVLDAALLVRETLALLEAVGIRPAKITALPPHWLPAALSMPDWLFRRLGNRMLAIDPLARSSMWEDLERGRRTEIDWINGEVLRLARQRVGNEAERVGGARGHGGCHRRA